MIRLGFTIYNYDYDYEDARIENTHVRMITFFLISIIK